jgi:hypothetical protein
MTLEQLLAEARKHPMTEAEKLEQRISWVRGEILLADPDMPREEADRQAREAVANRDRESA